MDTEKLYFVFSLLVPLAMIVDFRSILNQRKKHRILFLHFLLIAAYGIVTTYSKFGEHTVAPLLITPVLSFSIYVLMLNFFKKRFGRLPIYTAMDSLEGLFYNFFFNIGYLVIGIFFPFGLILVLIEYFR